MMDDYIIWLSQTEICSTNPTFGYRLRRQLPYRLGKLFSLLFVDPIGSDVRVCSA